MNERDEKITPVYEPGSKAFRKLDNFWYHHKWKVIIIGFFAIVLLICTLQMCQREDSDIYIMYAGPYKFGQTDARSFKQAMSTVVTDKNGDGYSKAELVDLYILSDEQIQGKKEDLEANEDVGGVVVVNYEMFSSNYKAFEQHMWAGDTIICLLDPYLYESVYVVDDNGEKLSGFMKLSDVLGYVPENAYDEYSIRIKDTPLGKHFTILQNLEEDTLLCVREMSSMSSLWNKKRTEEYHAYCLDVFRAIFEFEAPEE
ncbi:MAG: hypothetical protein IJA60_07370 [Clostridia bacterium]|nr:hypothetical protein [Clostridia bacterium]